MEKVAAAKGNTGTNKALIIGGVIIILVFGTWMTIRYLSPKKTADEASGDDDTQDGSGGGTSVATPGIGPATSTTPSSSSSAPSTGTIKYSATPFKTKLEGDTFRMFVNRAHPEWAKQNELDIAGAIDNGYIRKAWSLFGNEYKMRVKPLVEKRLAQWTLNPKTSPKNYPEYLWY